MPKYGVLVAEENNDVRGDKLLRLDSNKKQFKYRKIIDYKFSIPAIAVSGSWNKDLRLYFNEDQSSIGFYPAYEYYVQSFDGNWSIPVTASSQAYESSNPQAPFYRADEYVTDKYLNVSLYIENENVNPPFTPTYPYPAYTATLRLIITFDDLSKL